jgi:hypothetical protein
MFHISSLNSESYLNNNDKFRFYFTVNTLLLHKRVISSYYSKLLFMIRHVSATCFKHCQGATVS